MVVELLTTEESHGAQDAQGGAGEHSDVTDTRECRNVEDFYLPGAREAIGRFCQRYLEEHALTPTELLHNPRYQNSFSNTPTFVSVLQQAERITERKGAVTDLVNDLSRQARERLKDAILPDITQANYAAAATRLLESNPGFAGSFLLDAALTNYMMQVRSYGEKAWQLITLAESTADPVAVEPVERLLAEILRTERGIASCSEDAPFVTTVDCIVAMIAGDKALPEDAPQVFRGLERLVRRGPASSLRDGLISAFRREMSKPDRFTISSSGDLFGIESVQREITALAELAQRLRNDDGYVGGERTEASLQRRTALLVNEDTLPEITKGRNFAQKLRVLFMLQQMPLSPSAGRAVNDYLSQFFEGRDFAARLLDCWKDRADKLRGLGEVQKSVLDSGFAVEEKDRLAGVLDDIQSAFIRTQRLISPLQAKDDPSPDTVLEIVKLAGDGAFCAGKSRAAVAKALYRQVHRPRFVRAFLLGATGGKERAARASWLRAALAVIGVPFLDLGRMRALVVDDEEGPRSFIQSVLAELGIGTIDTAVDGQAALDLVVGQEEKFDLIVCDWMMPRASGLDVLKRVREARRDLPFLMVTALATLKAVERALAHQVSGYIAKPFTPEQLEEKVLLVLTQKNAPSF